LSANKDFQLLRDFCTLKGIFLKRLFPGQLLKQAFGIMTARDAARGCVQFLQSQIYFEVFGFSGEL